VNGGWNTLCAARDRGRTLGLSSRESPLGNWTIRHYDYDHALCLYDKNRPQYDYMIMHFSFCCLRLNTQVCSVQRDMQSKV